MDELRRQNLEDELHRRAIREVEEILRRSTAAAAEPPHAPPAGDPDHDESFYVEIWNDGYREDRWTPLASTLNSTGRERDTFPGFSSKKLPDLLDETELGKYFGWRTAAEIGVFDATVDSSACWPRRNFPTISYVVFPNHRRG